MKRVLTILALLLLPLSVWAMTPVSDSDLSNVTGQAGVNINADLLMNVRIGTMAWGDADGLDGGNAYMGYAGWDTTDDGGYVGIKNFNLTNLRIKAREDDTYDDWSTTDLKPITIDVAQDAGMYGGATFVRFGLGSLKITMDKLEMTIALASDTDFDTTVSNAVLGEELGSANIGPLELYIDPASYVDIWTEQNQGVNMTMSIEIDHIELDYVSWGDSDGLPDGSIGIGGVEWLDSDENGAGYIGLENLVMGVINISGTMRIDVMTSEGGAYYHAANLVDGATYVSVVRIGFGYNGAPFNVNVEGPITANVKLDNVAALNGGADAGLLGDIYLSGFGLDIAAGSWVDIWAH